MNDGYWAEKGVANDGEKKEFSADLFRALVTRLFKEYVEERVDPEDLADPDDSPPEWVARLWQELEREVLSDSEEHDALANAIRAMSDFEPTDPDYSDFRISDAWEYASSLQQYTFHSSGASTRSRTRSAPMTTPLLLPNRQTCPMTLPRLRHCRWPIMADPIKVTVTDPATGEVLQERLLVNDYAVICAGDRYVKNVQIMGATHMIAVAKEKPNG